MNKTDSRGLDWMDDFIDLNDGVNSDDAKKQIDGTKGYGDDPDKSTQDLAKDTVDIIDNRRYREYKACTQLMSAKRCKEMYPHKEREKKEKSCQL